MQTGLFYIGLSGLNVANAGLAVTAHNISNEATVGYHRQAMRAVTNAPMPYGRLWIGQGAHVHSIYRIQDTFLQRQIEKSTARLEYLAARQNEMSLIENTLGDTDLSIQKSISSFFTSLQNLGQNPSASSGQVYSSGNVLISHLKQILGEFGRLTDVQNQEKADIIREVNNLAKGIARLNAEILAFDGHHHDGFDDGIHYYDTEGVRADLLDRRDQLLIELNQYVKADVLPQHDATYQVVVGNGLNLVQGGHAAELTINPNGGVNFLSPTGNQNIALTSDFLVDGKLAGILAAQNDLDKLKLSLAQGTLSFVNKFNAQHHLGVHYTSDGTPVAGGDFFSVANGLTQINTVAEANEFLSGLAVSVPEGEVALGSGIQAEIDSKDPSFGVASWIQINPDLQDVYQGSVSVVLSPSVTVTYTGGQWISRAGTVVSNGSNGYYVELRSERRKGQRLHFDPQTTKPIKEGTRIIFSAQQGPPGHEPNSNNAIALLDLRNNNLYPNGETFEQSVTHSISDFAFDLADVNRQLGIEQSYLESLVARRDNISGVDPDEEAANLMFFQQMYQACAKTLQVSNDVLDNLFALIR